MLTIHCKKTAQDASIMTDDAMQFVESLAVEFTASLALLLQARQAYRQRIDAGDLPNFLPGAGAIRNGDWTAAPPPAELEDRRVEITAPATPKMVVNALNSTAKVYMACFEDALTPSWHNLMAGQAAIRCAVRHDYSFTDPISDKHYTLKPDYTCKLMVRPRGLHLPEKHLTINGQPIPAALMDAGLFLFHNAKYMLAHGATPAIYLAKIEHADEAAWWDAVLQYAETQLGLPKGAIKVTVLIETFPAVFEMDEILHALRTRVLGLNCGRWDYIFSYIKTLASKPEYLLPDRKQVTMLVPFMRNYSKLLIETCHKRGVHAMGGMSAFIPVRGDRALNEAAFEQVQADKKREAQDGHDGTWVAHPDLVEVAQAVFDRIMPEADQKSKMGIADTLVAADLLSPAQGEPTLEGFNSNIEAALRYMTAWFGGHGAVPIFNLMEDAATAEIARTQLWQWVNYGTQLAGGEHATSTLFEQQLASIGHTIESECNAAQKMHLDQAMSLLQRLTQQATLADFFTLDAYDMLSEESCDDAPSANA